MSFDGNVGRELGNMREVQEEILKQLKRIADSLDKLERYGIETHEHATRMGLGGR